jgi:hypothetical protein
MNIVRKSMVSNITRTRDLNITEEQLENYEKKGMLIQDAMPNLSVSDRDYR